MKSINSFAAAVGAVALTGLALAACGKSVVTGEGGEKLTLYEPQAVTLQRGATAKVDLKIKRNALAGEVSIAFSGLPKGVDVVDANSKIVGDAGTYTLRASDTADLVENSVARVTATGKDGIGATTSVTVSVTEKDKQ